MTIQAHLLAFTYSSKKNEYQSGIMLMNITIKQNAKKCVILATPSGRIKDDTEKNQTAAMF